MSCEHHNHSFNISSGSDGDDEQSAPNQLMYGLGIALGLVGSICINFGNNLQALGMQRHATIMAQSRWASAAEPSKSERCSQVALINAAAASETAREEGGAAASAGEGAGHPRDAARGIESERRRASREGAGPECEPLSPRVSCSEPPAPKPEKRKRRRRKKRGPLRPELDEPTKIAIRRCKHIGGVGTFIFIFGSLINFAAFAFAPASVLAPLEAIQFVTNILFGRFVHKTVITLRMKLGTALAIGGTVVAVVSGPASVLEMSFCDLKAFWGAPAWIGWVCLANGVAALLLTYWHFSSRALQSGKPWPRALTLLPVSFAVSSTLIGTQGVVQAKVLSEVVSMLGTHGAGHVFGEWFTYFALALFLLPTIWYLYRLSDALSKYSTLFIIPMLQATYILFATVAGGIYFQEFSTFRWWQYLAFFSGIAVMLWGLCLLIPPNPETTVEDREPAQQRRNLIQPAQILRKSPSASAAAAVSVTATSDGIASAAEAGIDISEALSDEMALPMAQPPPPQKPPAHYAAKLERARRAAGQTLQHATHRPLLALAQPAFDEAPVPVASLANVQVHASAMDFSLDFSLDADDDEGRVHVRRPHFSLLPPVVTSVDDTAALLALDETLRKASEDHGDDEFVELQI